MTETAEDRLRRLRIRSWRRGTREMDLILGRFADAYLDSMSADMLDRYDALLEENDQDLYAWVTNPAHAPNAHAPVIEVIADSLHKD